MPDGVDYSCEPWTWQILPEGLIWHSYLAGPKEPRLGGTLVSDIGGDTKLDGSVGGRAGLIRYGNTADFRPQGWQFDVEGGAIIRQDLTEDSVARLPDADRQRVRLNAPRGNVIVRGDEALLGMLFSNALSNALKFGRQVEVSAFEAEEEVGLAREFVEPIGYLDLYGTAFGFRILPTVAKVKPGFTLVINESEVVDAFEVPLAFLMNPENHQIHAKEFRGMERSYYAMPYAERYIWGATAGILRVLYERIYLS